MSHTSRAVTLILLAASFYVPSLALAAINVTYIQTYSTSIINIINTYLVPVFFAIAFIVFLWGIVKYFFIHGAEDAEREKGRWFILWGVIAFAAILSVWGLVNIVSSTLGIPTGSNNSSITPPTFKTGD